MGKLSISARSCSSASAALPGLFTPVRRDGQLLVDGGVLNNLPLDVVREMGADVVIGVDIVPPYTHGDPPASVVEVAQRSFFLLSSKTVPDRSLADVIITPDVGSFLFSDFRSVEALIEKGREAAEAALPEIRQALRRWEPQPIGWD